MRVRVGEDWKHIPVTNCTGFRADALLLDERDISALARMTDAQLVATVKQLSARVFRANLLHDEKQQGKA